MGIDAISSVDNQDEAWVTAAIEKAIPPPSFARIPKLPKILLVGKTSDYYRDYYWPKVVSIGPYHHDTAPELDLVEKLKPVFTKNLLSNYNVAITTLFKKLGGVNMVQELRSFYEEKSTDTFSDKEFTKMMLLDGCFILYYILYIFGEKAGSCRELRRIQTEFIEQDLFLLENQIPFKVVKEVIDLLRLDGHVKIRSLFSSVDDSLVRPRMMRKRSRYLFCFGLCGSTSTSTQRTTDENSQQQRSLRFELDHLLHLQHFYATATSSSTTTVDRDTNTYGRTIDKCTFRSVNELVDVGINFKRSRTRRFADVEFFGRWWWFSSDVKLPPIAVDYTTKQLLLNLTAYEMCSPDDSRAWVTSYICLLDSLIDRPEDVKALRKAGVLDTSLGSDKEVATLFNEIGTNLVPNEVAYSKVKNQIQQHVDNRGNTMFSQLKHEYIRSPWSFLALLGAVLALFLSGVQTYFTVWGPTDDCDDLCKLLKITHHF